MMNLLNIKQNQIESPPIISKLTNYISLNKNQKVMAHVTALIDRRTQNMNDTLTTCDS